MGGQPKRMRRRWLWFGLAGAGVAGAVLGARRGRVAEPPALPATLDSRALDREVWADLLGTDAEVRQAAVALVRARRESEPYVAALLKVMADPVSFSLVQRNAAGEALEYLGDPRINARDPEMIRIPAGPFKMGTPESDAPGIIEEYKHVHVIPRFLAKEAPQHM